MTSYHINQTLCIRQNLVELGLVSYVVDLMSL